MGVEQLQPIVQLARPLHSRSTCTTTFAQPTALSPNAAALQSSERGASKVPRRALSTPPMTLPAGQRSVWAPRPTAQAGEAAAIAPDEAVAAAEAASRSSSASMRGRGGS